jgi:cytochrome c-type biogenesis protein CcmE
MPANPRKRFFLGVASVVVFGGALVLVLSTTAADAFQYYKHVDEVTPALAQWEGKSLQLHGFALPGSIKTRINKDTHRREFKFVATNCGAQIDVVYEGIDVIPDTFRDGAEAVVVGRLQGGVFHATKIEAKCPSKYEMKAGAQQQTLCSKNKGN